MVTIKPKPASGKWDLLLMGISRRKLDLEVVMSTSIDACRSGSGGCISVRSRYAKSRLTSTAHASQV